MEISTYLINSDFTQPTPVAEDMLFTQLQVIKELFLLLPRTILKRAIKRSTIKPPHSELLALRILTNNRKAIPFYIASFAFN